MGKIHPGASKCEGNNTSGLFEEARRVLSFCRIPRSELARGDYELDEALCDFADELYLNGEDSHAGDKLRAALEFERPEAMRNGQLQLPRFKRAQKGWRKMAPTQVPMPMVEFIKSSITGMLIHLGEKEMALFNKVTFSTYARPGEMFKIYPADVVPRNNTFHHDVIVL